MKELEREFVGKGQVKGFIFTQLKKSEYAYLYRVNLENSHHFEVFKRKVNTQYNCVSYPSDKAFGIWAWTYKNIDKALDKFDDLEVQNG